MRTRDGGANGSRCTFVYIEGEIPELVGAPEVFVGSVALAVYAVECGFEALQKVGSLAVDISTMGGRSESLPRFRLIVYSVDDAIVADPNSPIFSTLEFSYCP